jgi:hypothetical protein
MTITPSDSLDLLIAHGPPDATDFAKQIAGLPGAYYAGLDEAYKRRQQDLFQGGVPLGPDGKPDEAAMSKAIIQAGGAGAVPSYAALSNLDLQRQSLVLGDRAVQQMGAVEGAPPSTGNTGAVSASIPAPASTSYRTAPDTGTSILSAVAPILGDENAAKIGQGIAGRLGVSDLNMAVTPQQFAQAEQMARQYNAARGITPPTAAPAQQPAPAQAAPTQNVPAPAAAPVQGSPTPIDPDTQKKIAFYTAIAGNQRYPEAIRKAAQTRLEALQKEVESTGDIKGYNLAVRQGYTGSFEQWKDKDTKDKRETAVLTKSIIPMVDKSREGAASAVKDIEAIGQVNETLNADKGIISGIRAGDRLALKKVGSYFGFDDRQVANTEAFRAAMGQRVASIIKAFGSGTAISEGDRKYSQQMVGGQIELDEKSIRKILDIGMRAAQAAINKHNDLVNRTTKVSPELKKFSNTYRVDAPPTRAPDGNFYIPDPDRPGKYLQVK